MLKIDRSYKYKFIFLSFHFIDLSIFRPIPSCLDFRSFILSLEIRLYEVCNVLFLKPFWLFFISEAIWPWYFHCRKAFNFKFNFSNRYWAIHVFKNFLIVSLLVIWVFLIVFPLNMGCRLYCHKTFYSNSHHPFEKHSFCSVDLK